MISDVQTIQQQKAGNDLVLSIDRRIQYLAYRELLVRHDGKPRKLRICIGHRCKNGRSLGDGE